MNDFTASVIQIIQAIPHGKVAGYGQIATMAGNARAARVVSRILHTCTGKHALPWWRVIRNSGEIALQGEGGALQKEMLLAEGIVFIGNAKLDMEQYAWKGDSAY
ncbi:MAG: MGMT family protein [Candidatus Cloacimonetes bacterium]|nr:MGMT family protein [Candidatus Cloacimonadota bacterium]